MNSSSAGTAAAADRWPWRHCCCLYGAETERRAAIAPFLADGLQQGDKLLYLVDCNDTQATLDWLEASGLEAERHLRGGQLSVVTADASYLRGRLFDPDRMIAWLGEATERARAEGFSALRVTGEMTWALRGLPGCERLLEYETKVEGFLQQERCRNVCQYDLQRFDTPLLLDVLLRHQVAILRSQTYLTSAMAFAAYRAELAVASTQRSELLAEHATGISGIVNSEGVVTYVSGAVEHILGYPREEMVGKRIMELIQPVSEAESEVLQRVVESQDSCYTFEARVRRKDGSWRSGEVTFTNLLHVPSVAGIVANIRDITELLRLEKEILEGHVNEHRQLRHDIHDGLAGYFTALAFRTKVLQRKVGAGAAVHAEDLDEILHLVGGARSAVRALSKGLSPVGDGPEGLMSALRELASRRDATLGIPLHFKCACSVPVGDLFTATQAYRIVQEAVNNAVRHGKPTQVSITMSATGASITLAVRDDGVGIPDGAGEGPGMGLRTMQYRARLMNALLSVSRHPDGGTLTTLTFQDPTSRGGEE